MVTVTVEQARDLLGEHSLFPILERVITATEGLTREATIDLSPFEVRLLCVYYDNIAGANPATIMSVLLGSILVPGEDDPRKAFWERTGFAVRVRLGIHSSLEIYVPKR